MLLSRNRTRLSFTSFIFSQINILITAVCPAGLWFDLEISYSGSFLMTLETKMNLIRLGKEGENLRLGEFGKDG